MFPNAFHWAETALATWTTITLHMPVLAAHKGKLTAVERREAERMFTEKFTALEKGLWSTGIAWMELSSAAMTGEIRTANAAMRGWSDVLSAFTSPGRRTVKADARRPTAPRLTGDRRDQLPAPFAAFASAAVAAWERSSER